MLEPHNRQMLLEALRPPDGFHLDRAIGTTYTLDLLALLTTPLAFTFFDWSTEAGPLGLDPLLVLAAIRRNTERITIFCQAGRIQIPKRDQKLMPYLENMVVEVGLQKPGSSFHPKVWVLRFVGEEDAVRYRALCLSRNLTFDQSWDTILTLEGDLKPKRTMAFKRNHPLVRFVEALPRMALRTPSDSVIATIEQFKAELRIVEFELPDGFTDLSFWPLGIPDSPSWPFPADLRRILVISPFLSPSCLTRLTQTGRDHHLVSRPESLDACGRSGLARFDKISTLNERAEMENDGSATADGDQASPGRGLHAKLFVADDGWDGRIWTGSANATSAAFDRNVEFLVELRGKKSFCGIDAILESGANKTTLSSMLVLYDLGTEKPVSDPDKERLEKRLEDARRSLTDLRLEAHVASSDGQAFEVTLQAPDDTHLKLPFGVEVKTWPATLDEERAVPIVPSQVPLAVFPGLSFEALTSFFAFAVNAKEDGLSLTTRFAVTTRLIGAPDNRRERVLRSILANGEELLRLILLLLSAGEDGTMGGVDTLIHEMGTSVVPNRRSSHPHMLESLVRTLAHRPERLNEIADLVADLRADPDSATVIPKDFEAIWEPIWATHQRMQAENADETR
jgi:hypothetical protein